MLQMSTVPVRFGLTHRYCEKTPLNPYRRTAFGHATVSGRHPECVREWVTSQRSHGVSGGIGGGGSVTPVAVLAAAAVTAAAEAGGVAIAAAMLEPLPARQMCDRVLLSL